MADFLITDDNWTELDLFPDRPGVERPKRRRGMVARPWDKKPIGAYSGEPFSTDLFIPPRNEWPDRIRERESSKTNLSDLRAIAADGSWFESLNQGNQGFCWIYSVAACMTLLRGRAGMPHVRFSPHAGACKIFDFKDRGAWGALALDFVSKNGLPSQEYWPARSMDRRYNTAETWTNAARHRVAEGWLDMGAPHPADAKLTFDQVAALLLAGVPVVLDFNWWGHSVCGMDLVETSPGEFGVRILNSWSDDWGERGTAVLSGSRAIPDGACAPRSVVLT